eukprot:COSAG04_NODE_662_length_11447_cov_3.759958_3_plen_122_part_00
MDRPIKLKLDAVSSVEQVQAALQEKLGKRPPAHAPSRQRYRPLSRNRTKAPAPSDDHLTSYFYCPRAGVREDLFIEFLEEDFEMFVELDQKALCSWCARPFPPFPLLLAASTRIRAGVGRA